MSARRRCDTCSHWGVSPITSYAIAHATRAATGLRACDHHDVVAVPTLSDSRVSAKLLTPADFGCSRYAPTIAAIRATPAPRKIDGRLATLPLRCPQADEAAPRDADGDLVDERSLVRDY